MRCYGEPEYLALAVALKESGLRFFWHRELGARGRPGRGAEYRPLGTPQGPFFTEAGGRTLGKHPFLISWAYYCDINYKIQGAMGWQPGAD